MRLKLETKTGSLLPFEQELPQFTLITGLNGSGKSQLLRAIQNKIIATDAGGEQPLLFTSSSFKISDDQTRYIDFSTASRRDRSITRTAMNNAVLRNEWKSWGDSQGWDEENLIKWTQFVFSAHPTTSSLSYLDQPNSPQLFELRGLIDKLVSRTKIETMSADPFEGETKTLYQSIEQATNMPIFALKEEDLQNALLQKEPLFGVAVGPIFSIYRDKLLSNKIEQVSANDGDQTAVPLTNDEFVKRFGPPPWHLLNAVLQSANVDAQFIPPPLKETNFYVPALKNGFGDKFYPNELSSGEVIILNLALLGYLATDQKRKISAPPLILLDEVDGPLHPAMAKNFLQVVEDVLVAKFGVSVIATTHSPSTVAQAKDESIYVMTKGQPGLTSLPKDRAISILTEGVPTLSVRLDDRRQVFAESPVEAQNLDALYQILRPALRSPLSLQFISTGSKENNSGISHVRRIVGDLEAAGNQTVFGLVDWDTRNQPTDRIKVLAFDRRYALENIILDPVILVLAAYKLLKTDSLSHFGFDPNLSLFQLTSLDSDTWQRLSDEVTRRITGRPATKRVQCTYHGGMALELDQDYLRYPAHQLEEKVKSVYTFLEKPAQSGSGQLTKYLVDAVVAQAPDFIPIEVEQAFEELLAQ